MSYKTYKSITLKAIEITYLNNNQNKLLIYRFILLMFTICPYTKFIAAYAYLSLLKEYIIRNTQYFKDKSQKSSAFNIPLYFNLLHYFL